MSVYGPRFELPEIQMPEIGIDPKIIVGAIILIIIIALAVFLLPSYLDSLNPSLTVSWKNNPLDLKNNATIPAELTINLINTQKEIRDLNFEVVTPSDELLIFCPYTNFPNVDAGKTRNTTCIVRRNPESIIFSGTYDLTINSTLGSVKTTLEVITK